MTTNNPTSPREELAMKAEPNGGANPYYTPTIMAAFRAYKEAQYGGKLADEAFRLGKGKYEDEPHYTQVAIEFRLFKAGAEWVEAFRSDDPDFSRHPVKAASPEGVVEPVRRALVARLTSHANEYRNHLGSEIWADIVAARDLLSTLPTTERAEVVADERRPLIAHREAHVVVNWIEAQVRAAPPKPEALAKGEPNTLSDGKVREFILNWFAPWGSWKTAWWEMEVSDDVAMTESNAMAHLRRLLAAAPAPDSQGEES